MARCASSARRTTSFERINRRMHNKSWIADNRIAIVGGRNIGDEYFGASDEVNFVDLDFAMVGPGRARRLGRPSTATGTRRRRTRWKSSIRRRHDGR